MLQVGATGIEEEEEKAAAAMGKILLRLSNSEIMRCELWE
jgi:hypothetical protein